MTLEQIIVALIPGSILGIVGGYIFGIEKRTKLENDVNTLKEEIDKLKQPISPDPTNITNDEKNSYLNSLEVEITKPEQNEIISKEGTYPIRGIIKNIPEGMRLNNLSKELGLYVLLTSDDKKFWPSDEIQKEIDSNGQNGIKFHSSHFVNSSRDVLIVLAGEKAQGSIEFYHECFNNLFKEVNKYQPITKTIIGSDIKVLAKVHINFDPK